MCHYIRDEVWRRIFVRTAVECGEKKIIFTAYFLHAFAVNRVNRDELILFTAFSVFLQKRNFNTCLNRKPPACLQLLIHCANVQLALIVHSLFLDYIFIASGHASRAMAMPQRPVGLDMNLSQLNARPVSPRKKTFSSYRDFWAIVR